MSTKQYQGVAPLTMARTDTGGYVSIYAGDPVPGGIDAEDLDRLVKKGFLKAVKAAVEPEPAEAPKSDKVDDVLTEVGDDKDKAAAALETEQAGKNRPTLVAKLDAIANPAN